MVTRRHFMTSALILPVLPSLGRGTELEGSGVLVAHSGCDGDPGKHRVHLSDGVNLGAGPVVYGGCSPVTAMLPFRGGILCAFSNVANDPRRHRVHFSDGRDLGGGEVRYDGSSRVTSMCLSG
jgi:hypothetical protein